MPLLSGTIMEAHWKQHATINPESKVFKGWCSNPPGPVGAEGRGLTFLLRSGYCWRRDTPYGGSYVNQCRVEGRCEKEEMETLKAVQEIRQRLSQVSMETGCLRHMADIRGRSGHSKERMWGEWILSGSREKGGSVLRGQC